MSKYEVIEDGDYKVTIDYENLTTTFELTMNYQLEDLTLDDIRSASTNYLRSCLKEDIAPETDDMINKELYVREYRQCDNNISGTSCIVLMCLYGIIILYTDFQTMSTLHHEDILEDCYLEVLEEFRTDCLFMTQDQIDALVYEKFEARCQ